MSFHAFYGYAFYRHAARRRQKGCTMQTPRDGRREDGEDPVTLRTTEARQAVAPGVVRYVLGVSLILAVAAMVIIYVWLSR